MQVELKIRLDCSSSDTTVTVNSVEPEQLEKIGEFLSMLNEADNFFEDEILKNPKSPKKKKKAEG